MTTLYPFGGWLRPYSVAYLGGDSHFYPYHTVPNLECHIAPPFLAINGGRKCAGIDLSAITLGYCKSDDSRPALKRRLELLCEIWKLFQDTKEVASSWQRDKMGKRMRTSRGLPSPANAIRGRNRTHRKAQLATIWNAVEKGKRHPAYVERCWQNVHFSILPNGRRLLTSA